MEHLTIRLILSFFSITYTLLKSFSCTSVIIYANQRNNKANHKWMHHQTHSNMRLPSNGCRNIWFFIYRLAYQEGWGV
jgi:hypothetical protein